MAIYTPTERGRFHRGTPVTGSNPANKDVFLEFNRPVWITTWATSYSQVPTVACEFRIEIGNETELENASAHRAYEIILHSGVLAAAGDPVTDQELSRFSANYQGSPLLLGDKDSDHVRFTLSAGGPSNFGNLWVYARTLV